MITGFEKVAVCIPKKEFVEEHKHLLKVLRSKDHKDDLREAGKQSKELAKELKEK